ncbi:hypothetical protein DYB32_003183 [Aphanomyces invadans]|uniref:Methyltransferase FkbM domain-containing protein n=1 Tax=Aphanomyces invadans TaxID=157072 RepID=A0A3R7ABJ2_9STRA|nr:hypothetical protein DYB32_003183 [Aphanomyces invadans]
MWKSKFTFAPAADSDLTSPHLFRTMRPRQLCPLNQRLYLEIDRNLSDVCFFVDTQVEPAYCGRLDRDEPMFMKANVMPQPGPHFVMVTNGSQPMHAIFFTMVKPSVQLVRRGTSVAIEFDGVDIQDDRNRVCLVTTSSADSYTPFACFNSTYLSMHMTLPPLPHARTSVVALVVNEYNKCICRSNEMHLPQRADKTPPMVPPFMFASPKHHPNVPPSRESILHALFDQEYGVFSQNGEDGVLQLLFQLVAPTNKIFVEFGVEDGIECNTRYLREVHGWTGLSMDGSHSDPAWITPGNIVGLFEQHEIPSHFDLLSVDIDFNDYYVLQAILERYTPSVIVVEVNSHYRYPDDRVATYDPQGWDGVSNYFGATLAAFVRLLNGYTLVYCESHGVNCFFVRTDLWPATWREDPATIDRPPNFFGKGWRYPPSLHATWATGVV